MSTAASTVTDMSMEALNRAFEQALLQNIASIGGSGSTTNAPLQQLPTGGALSGVMLLAVKPKASSAAVKPMPSATPIANDDPFGLAEMAAKAAAAAKSTSSGPANPFAGQKAKAVPTMDLKPFKVATKSGVISASKING